MARGRMINQSITTSKQVLKLASRDCRLAFTWAIAFADREGRLTGDTELLKAMLFPKDKDITSEIMAEFITDWVMNDLAEWYEVDGEQIIQLLGFEKNQPGLRKEREGVSRYPDSSNGRSLISHIYSGVEPELSRQNDGVTPDLSHRNRTEFKRIKLNLNAREDDSLVDSDVKPKPDFIQWWEMYPNHDKQVDAERAWMRQRDKPDVSEMIETLKWQIVANRWTVENRRYIPTADRYLMSKRWMDEKPEIVEQVNINSMTGRPQI